MVELPIKRPVLIVAKKRLVQDTWRSEPLKWTKIRDPRARKSQVECCAHVWRCWDRRIGALLQLEVGGGKSAVALMLIRALLKREDDAPLRVQELHDERKVKRKLKLDPSADLITTTPETFKILSKHGIITPESVSALIMDESAKMKSPTSQISRLMRTWARTVPYRLLLSGAPSPGDNGMDWWPQLDFCEPGKWGTTTTFQRKWLRPAPGASYYNRQTGQTHIKRWEIAHPAAFANAVRHVCMTVLKADCLDLPSLTVEPVRVDLSATERRAYQRMLDEVKLEIGSEVVDIFDNRIQAIKLRQMSSGGCYDAEKKWRWCHSKSTKVETVIDLLTDELRGRSVLVFYQFVPEAEAIYRRLTDEGIACRIFNRQDDLDGWRDGKFPVLILHPASAGHGLTLTTASEEIWVGPTTDPDHWHQGVARIHRPPQTRPCTIFVVFGHDTRDEDIYNQCVAKAAQSQQLRNTMAAASG